MVYLSVIKEFRDEQEELLKEEQELSNKNVKNNKNGKQFHFSYKITPTKTITQNSLVLCRGGGYLQNLFFEFLNIAKY